MAVFCALFVTQVDVHLDNMKFSVNFSDVAIGDEVSVYGFGRSSRGGQLLFTAKLTEVTEGLDRHGNLRATHAVARTSLVHRMTLEWYSRFEYLPVD